MIGKLWVARDSKGRVHIFSRKPKLYKRDKCFDLSLPRGLGEIRYFLGNNVPGLEDLTFENSPREVELKLK